jgi:hypothetical protein
MIAGPKPTSTTRHRLMQRTGMPLTRPRPSLVRAAEGAATPPIAVSRQLADRLAAQGVGLLAVQCERPNAIPPKDLSATRQPAITLAFRREP